MKAALLSLLVIVVVVGMATGEAIKAAFMSGLLVVIVTITMSAILLLLFKKELSFQDIIHLIKEPLTEHSTLASLIQKRNSSKIQTKIPQQKGSALSEAGGAGQEVAAATLAQKTISTFSTLLQKRNSESKQEEHNMPSAPVEDMPEPNPVPAEIMENAVPAPPASGVQDRAPEATWQEEEATAETMAGEQDQALSEADALSPLPDIADELEEPLSPPVVSSSEITIHLSKQEYAARLNAIEQRQRKTLEQAIRLGSGQEFLQRSLVVVNNKLSLLAENYAEEIRCYQEIMQYLAVLNIGLTERMQAMEALQEGQAQKAEKYLTKLSRQSRPFAAKASYYSGQLAECRVDLQKALNMYRQAVALAPDNPLYLKSAGRTARTLYRYDEALPWLENFARLLDEQRESNPLEWALAQRELAYIYVLRGQYKKAGPLYKLAMTTLAGRLGQYHPELAVSWYQIGEFQESLGEYEKAIILYKKALHIFEHQHGTEHPILINILDRLAALYMELELEREAMVCYERLVRIQQRVLRPSHLQLALSFENLGEAYRLQGQYAKAEACYRQSLAVNQAAYGDGHPSVAIVLQELAKLCINQHKLEDARNYQEQAAAIFRKNAEFAGEDDVLEALTLDA